LLLHLDKISLPAPTILFNTDFRAGFNRHTDIRIL